MKGSLNEQKGKLIKYEKLNKQAEKRKGRGKKGKREQMLEKEVAERKMQRGEG